MKIEPLTLEELSARYIEPAIRASAESVFNGDPIDDETKGVLNALWPEWRMFYGINQFAYRPPKGKE